ncbi:MAG: 30S ribosomal protein S13 [Candidatus Pacearchaeota archaeon]|nr:30S ribosomal protein S13 [Candidatus Pacearchaeota archaeon]
MAAEEKQKKNQNKEEEADILVRISGQDIGGNKNIYVGLTKIRGVSWSLSNAVCKKTGINKVSKIAELDKNQIEEIEKFLEDAKVFEFLKNRRNDLETGESKHLLSNDLDMKKEFDIKRLKQIKSYRGIRHSFKLPVRGQRTRSNFRRSGIAVGVKKKKK